MTVRAFVILALIAATAANAAPPTTCGAKDPYASALCAYQRRNFAEAERGFRAIVDANEPEPETIRATYFLARTEMKLGRWAEAEALLIRIYSMSTPFYEEWNCDFLLGQCRIAQGKS